MREQSHLKAEILPICVVPEACLIGQQYLAAGYEQEIIEGLSEIPGLAHSDLRSLGTRTTKIVGRY